MDIFALGVMLYGMFMNNFPDFTSLKDEQVLTKIDDLDSDLFNIIAKCLEH